MSLSDPTKAFKITVLLRQLKRHTAEEYLRQHRIERSTELAGNASQTHDASRGIAHGGAAPAAAPASA